MTQLIFPASVTVRLMTVLKRTEEPFHSPDAALFVRTFARRKNDYHLGPFFSDPEGIVAIDGAVCQRLADAHLEMGIMDRYRVSECFSLVELYHLADQHLESAIAAVKEYGVPANQEWFCPKDEMLKRYRAAKNMNLQEVLFPLRDEWEGKGEATYTYHVFRRGVA